MNNNERGYSVRPWAVIGDNHWLGWWGPLSRRQVLDSASGAVVLVVVPGIARVREPLSHAAGN